MTRLVGPPPLPRGRGWPAPSPHAGVCLPSHRDRPPRPRRAGAAALPLAWGGPRPLAGGQVADLPRSAAPRFDNPVEEVGQARPRREAQAGHRAESYVV